MGLDVPEPSSHLPYIRHEVDAREEVEEIDAATDRPTGGGLRLDEDVQGQDCRDPEVRRVHELIQTI